MPLDAPTRAKPTITSSVEIDRVASAVTPQPIAPSAKPALITGVRPTRSIKRPANTDVNPEEVRKIAGPSPRRPLTPVTRTNVSDETAAVSCRTAELTAIVAERIRVLRRIGSFTGASLGMKSFNQAGCWG
jgi:hypothetical protein